MIKIKEKRRNRGHVIYLEEEDMTRKRYIPLAYNVHDTEELFWVILAHLHTPHHLLLVLCCNTIAPFTNTQPTTSFKILVLPIKGSRESIFSKNSLESFPNSQHFIPSAPHHLSFLAQFYLTNTQPTFKALVCL